MMAVVLTLKRKVFAVIKNLFHYTSSIYFIINHINRLAPSP